MQFPYLFGLATISACFAGRLCTAMAEPKQTYNIAILGDSITAGYGVAPAEAFPHKLQELLNKTSKQKVIINAAGVSGSTSASGAERLRWLMKKPIDLLLIELGANDGLRGQTIAGIKENLKTMIAMATEKKIKTKLMEVELPKNYGQAYRSQFKAMFFALRDETNVGLIEYFFDDIQKQTKELLFLPDKLHPNATGHTLIAKHLADVLQSEIP